MQDLLFVNDICRYFNLGKLLSKPERIQDGTLHCVWKTITENGIYIIKELNSALEKIPNKNLASIEQTQLIAEKMYENGIPTVIAIHSNQHYVYHVQGKKFMAFPYVDGECQLEKNSLQHVIEIGELLAKIHQVKITVPDLPKPAWSGFLQSHWQQLIQSAQSKVLWINEIENRMSDLLIWNDCAHCVQSILDESFVVSHRDLDAKNVIWQNHHLVLIDWEYAGYIHPDLELFIVAMNWSGILQGQFDLHLFKALTNSYQLAKNKKVVFSFEILAGYYGYVLDWVEWNLRRAIFFPTQQDVAHQQIICSLNTLKWVSKMYALKSMMFSGAG